MKSKKNLLEQLKNLPYFGKDTIHQLGGQLGLKVTTVDTYISRFLGYKDIFKLKRGMYISADFSSVNGKFNFFIASPAKALFDLLYFKTPQFRGVKMENVKPLVEALRIDIDEMDKGEQDKFYEMLKKNLNHE